MNKQFKRMAAVLALCGFLFTGMLAGTAMSQARAVTTVGTVTIRSIISGTLGMVAGGVAGGTTFKPGGTMYWEFTNTPTIAGSTAAISTTPYSIPAGTLGTNGDRLSLHLAVTLGTAATDTKTATCNVGYSAFTASTGVFTGGLTFVSESTASNTGAVTWWIDALVTRTAAANTASEWQSKWGSNATTQGGNWGNDTGSVTWANANNLLCEVRNSTASNTEVMTLDEMRVIWEPR